MADRNEKHLDVYEDRYELHQNGETIVYYQGVQNQATQRRYALINQTLAEGYLERKFSAVQTADFPGCRSGTRPCSGTWWTALQAKWAGLWWGWLFCSLPSRALRPSRASGSIKAPPGGDPSPGWRGSPCAPLILHTTPPFTGAWTAEPEQIWAVYDPQPGGKLSLFQLVQSGNARPLWGLDRHCGCHRGRNHAC